MSTWTAAKRARYGGTHRAERKRWAPLVAAGVAPRDPILEQFRPQEATGSGPTPQREVIQSNASTPAAVAMTTTTTQSCQLSGGIMALPLDWDGRRYAYLYHVAAKHRRTANPKM
jgi:hypothetical protein